MVVARIESASESNCLIVLHQLPVGHGPVYFPGHGDDLSVVAWHFLADIHDFSLVTAANLLVKMIDDHFVISQVINVLFVVILVSAIVVDDHFVRVDDVVMGHILCTLQLLLALRQNLTLLELAISPDLQDGLLRPWHRLGIDILLLLRLTSLLIALALQV